MSLSSRTRTEVTSHILIGFAFLVLNVYFVILVLTVIGKECHDSRLADLGRRQYHIDNVTIHYGPGTGTDDSEKGVGAEQLMK